MDRPIVPPADLPCCLNCKHWHKKQYIHCQCSGPWGGNLQYDKKCTFAWKRKPAAAAMADKGEIAWNHTTQ